MIKKRKVSFRISSKEYFLKNKNTIIKKLSEKPGVYIYKINGNIFYIGSTINLGDRGLRFYKEKIRGNVSVIMYFCKYLNLLDLERYYRNEWEGIKYEKSIKG